MAKANTQVKESFGLYTELLTQKKILRERAILLDDSASTNNRNFIKKKVLVYHGSLSEDIELMIDCKRMDHAYFLLKLRCNTLCGEPFFHYDSDGPAHENYMEEHILKYGRQITTPHFNAFDHNGINYAYHTEELKDENTRAALKDINLAVHHFADQANLEIEHPDFEILFNDISLPFKAPDYDPLIGKFFK